jgi:hypothetical protein
MSWLLFWVGMPFDFSHSSVEIYRRSCWSVHGLVKNRLHTGVGLMNRNISHCEFSRDERQREGRAAPKMAYLATMSHGFNKSKTRNHHAVATKGGRCFSAQPMHCSQIHIRLTQTIQWQSTQCGMNESISISHSRRLFLDGILSHQPFPGLRVAMDVSEGLAPTIWRFLA